MRAHHVVACGLAVPVVLTVALWAAVNVMIAFRTDPIAYLEAEHYFQQLHTLLDEPAQ